LNWVGCCNGLKIHQLVNRHFIFLGNLFLPEFCPESLGKGLMRVHFRFRRRSPEQFYGTHINVKTKLYSTILLKMVSIKTKLLHAKNNYDFLFSDWNRKLAVCLLMTGNQLCVYFQPEPEFSCLALHIFQDHMMTRT